MSTKTVDERVVSMKFDNRQFENGVAETMGTLDKFKSKLNLTGATKGLEEVSNTAKRIDFSGLGSGVDAIHAKFSALQIMGVTALSNITNSAVNAGKRIVSALTVDPIKTGLSEYETQINAVQTILANTESKGTTLGQVNAALDELNKYADMTIYNFTEMTRNIGTFTAAGVDLDTSVNAIKGIANLAAVSGSSSQQASTAMYQLSQALSSGTVKLMDWNSVVNAGMGGQVFQDALKETARNHGVAIDDMITKEGSFRETLKNGWLTADILTETLQHFTMAAEEGTDQWNQYKKSLMDDGYTAKQAEAILKLSNTATNAATKVKTFTQLWETLKETAQSGWTQTWEIILGDFGEAKEMFTGIYEMLSPMLESMSKARNELLSGGLSSGWKQLLGLGIADEEGYRDSIKKIAEDRGIAINDMIKAEQELDSSLSDTDAFQKALQKSLADGTINADILSDSVTNLADKMRGMSAEERKAAGYTEDHIIQIEALEKGLKDGSISMDEFVKKMQRPSGRENIIEALYNSIKAIISVVTPVKEAFRDIFPAMTGEQLYAITETLRDFTARLTLSEEASTNLKRTFKGLFAILDIGRQALVAVFEIVKPLFGGVGDLGGSILETTASWGDWLVNLNETIKTTNIFGTAVAKIQKAFSTILSYIKPVFGGIAQFLGYAVDGIKSFGESVGDVFSAVTSKADRALKPFEVLGLFIKSVFTAIGDIVRKVAPGAFKFAEGIGDLFKNLMSNIASAIRDADYSKLFDTLNAGIFSGIGIFIARFIKSGGDILDNAGGFLENINNLLEGVSDAIGAFTQSLKAKALKEIAVAIAILAAALLVLSFIDSEKLGYSLGAISVLFAELMLVMDMFAKTADGVKVKNIRATARALTSISTALLILALAMKIVSTMSWQEMGVGLISITVGLGLLVGAVNLLPEKTVNKAAKAIRTMSTALVILGAALKIMGSMSWEEMGISLISMAVGLGAMVGAVNLLPKDASIRTLGMLGLATAMVVLGAAMKIMASMSWKEMGIALISMAGALGLIVAAVALLPKDAALRTAGMLGLAAAMVILGSALKIMGSMSWTEMGIGLISMAGGLAIMVGAVNLLPKDAALRTLGMLGLAAAVVILAEALKIMGSMTIEEMAKSLATLFISMGTIALFTNAMNGALPGAAAMLVVAAAIAIFAPALKTLGSMTWEEIAKGIAALAGVFLVLGAAGLVLGPLTPTLLALAGAVALFGVGVAALGAGVALFSAGVAALAVALSAGGGAIVIFISSLIGLIPYAITQIGIGIISLCNVIAGSAVAICGAATVVIHALVGALVNSIPVVADGALQLVVGILEALVKYTPTIVTLLFDLFIGVIDALAVKLPELTKSVVNLFMAFFNGVIDALGEVGVDSLVDALAGIGIMSAMMLALGAIAALTPAAMLGVLGLSAVVAEMALMLAAIGALAQIPGLSWLVSEGGNFLQTVGTAIGQFLGGIIGGVAKGMTSSLPGIGSDLSAFMINATPFLMGAKMIDATMMNGVKSLAETILILTAADIVSGLTSWLTGGSSLADFGAQLGGLGTNLNQFVTNLGTFGEAQVTTVGCAANAVKAFAEAAKTLPNEGGWAAKILGDNSIATFGSYLPNLGKHISSFAKNLGTFGDDKVATVQCAANAIKALASAAKDLPNEGGWAAKILGDNSIATFGSYLPSLGVHISTFAKNLGTFDEAKVATVQCAGNAIKAMAAAAKDLPNEGGWAAKILGDNSISTFASSLPGLGTNVKDFAKNLGTFDDAKVATVNASVKAIKAFSGLADADLKAAKTHIPGFGDKLPDLGTDIANLCKNMPSTTTLDSAITNINKILNLIKTIADANSGALKTFADNLKTVGNNAVKKFVEAFTSDSAKKDVKSAATNLGQQAVDGAESKKTGKKDSMESAGKDLGDGLVNGIKAKETAVYNAGYALGQKAVQGEKDGQKSKSPSKLTTQAGIWLGEGLIVGMERIGRKVYDSGHNMGSTVTDSIGSMMSKVASLIDSDIDTQPTIRPVMDLSDVRAGTNTLNGMLNFGSSVGLSANVGAISNAMNRRAQNGDNSDVVSAIDKLRKDVGNMNGTSYNINGVSVNGDSGVEDAVRTLVRAITTEGRV